jgi:hypothetical protein
MHRNRTTRTSLSASRSAARDRLSHAIARVRRAARWLIWSVLGGARAPHRARAAAAATAAAIARCVDRLLSPPAGSARPRGRPPRIAMARARAARARARACALPWWAKQSLPRKKLARAHHQRTGKPLRGSAHRDAALAACSPERLRLETHLGAAGRARSRRADSRPATQSASAPRARTRAGRTRAAH